MKAVILNEAGGIEKFNYVDLDLPICKSKEVLVKVKAISVNPVDFKVRANEDVLTMIYAEHRPAILGWDVAGVVEKIGDEVSEFEIGDRVFGMINFVGAGNAYAEFVSAPVDHLSKIPDSVTFVDAAACTLAALTALQVLRGKVSKNDRVLIHAGSGGVGHFAIQMAKSLGAFVISTSSAKNKDFILSLGADEHLDYRSKAFEKTLSNIDFIFDMFNGEILHKSVELVNPNGTVVSIPTPEFSQEVQDLAKEKNVNLQFHMVESSASDMSRIAQMLADGTIKPFVSKKFDFQHIGDAHLQLESGRTTGKVVIEL